MLSRENLISLILEGDLDTFPSALANYLKEHDIDSLKLNHSFLVSKVIKEIPHIRHSFFLTIAAQRGHLNTVTLLLENGATIAATSEGSINILVAGVDSGSVEMVQFLLDKGAQLSDANCLLTTPLIHATELGHVDIVALLLLEHHNKNCEMKDRHLLTEAALAHLPSSQETALALIEILVEHRISDIPSEFILPKENTSINLLSELFKIFEKTGKYLSNSKFFNKTTQAQIKQHHDRLDTQKQATTQLTQNNIPPMLSIVCPIITDYLFEPNPSLNFQNNPSNNNVQSKKKLKDNKP